MGRRKQRWMCGCIVAIAGGGWISSVDAEQVAVRRAPAETKAPMQVSLTIGAQKYDSTAPGKCTHAPVASIYGTVSELWTAQQSEDGRSMSLSLWRPKDGSPDMMSLSVSSGRSSTNVSTVRGTNAVGSGKVTLAPDAKGGVFSVDAQSATGTALKGTIKCEAFVAHEAAGG